METAASSTTPAAPSPLTTTFTPPRSCLTDLWAAHSSGSTWMNLGPIDATECLPSGWSPWSAFSAGICPSGWIMASNLTLTSVNEKITLGTCCPQYSASNWIFSTRPEGSSDDPLYNTEICQWAPSTTIYYGYTWINNGSTTSAPGSMTPGGLWNAYGIMVKWQSTDNLYPTTVSATTTTFVAPSARATIQQSEGTSSGMTTGAKAGIGAGVAVGAIFVLLGLGFLILRRRKSHKKPQTQVNTNGEIRGSSFELAANERHELNSTPLHELGGLSNSVHVGPFELDGVQR